MSEQEIERHINADVLLTREEAASIDQEIINSANVLRESLWIMYSQEGWKALEFASWQQYLESVSERAGLAPTTLSKHTRVALLEANSEYPIGTFREGAVRNISFILSNNNGFTERSRLEALDLAVERSGGTDEVTGPIATAAAYEIALNKVNPYLSNKVKSGELAAKVAYKIHDIYKNADQMAASIILECTDLRLAIAIFNLSTGGHHEELFHEIHASGHIPSSGGRQVPVEDATIADLTAYMREKETMRFAEAKSMEREKMYAVCAAARDYIRFKYGNRIPERDKEPYAHELRRTLVKVGMIDK